MHPLAGPLSVHPLFVLTTGIIATKRKGSYELDAFLLASSGTNSMIQIHFYSLPKHLSYTVLIHML